MSRHTPETAAATLILLICGGALVSFNRLGMSSSMMSLYAAALGPITVILGIGMALHGRSMPPTHITPFSRWWGTLGSIAGSVNLWALGYFDRGGLAGKVLWLMPVVLLAAWWLPRRFYGEEPAPSTEGSGPDASALARLLDALEWVADRHPELFDTDVRERMWEVVEARYVRRDLDGVLPEKLGMFTPQGDLAVRSVLDRHLRELAAVADRLGLVTEVERLQLLQDPTVKSRRRGLTYDAFFGAP